MLIHAAVVPVENQVFRPVQIAARAEQAEPLLETGGAVQFNAAIVV
jgi:hypothetical protein